ncbi:MAG: hypothetical protein DLM70_04255, partial [Chloroflexi bacterium]
VWVEGQQNPWLLFTDLRPRAVGIAWYGLRMWIEMGFKVLKGLGWHWDKTRRTDPDRVARYWLVLAVATILTLATATRIEDAALLALPPAMLHAPPTRPRWRPLGTTRTVSLISQGIADLRRRSLSASSGPDTGSVPSHGPTHRLRSRCTTMIRPNVLIPTPVSPPWSELAVLGKRSGAASLYRMQILRCARLGHVPRHLSAEAAEPSQAGAGRARLTPRCRV